MKQISFEELVYEDAIDYMIETEFCGKTIMEWAKIISHLPSDCKLIDITNSNFQDALNKDNLTQADFKQLINEQPVLICCDNIL